MLNYTSIGFSEMRSRSERYLSPWIIWSSELGSVKLP